MSTIFIKPLDIEVLLSYCGLSKREMDMTKNFNTVESFWSDNDYVFYAGPFRSDEEARQKVYAWSRDGSDFDGQNAVVYRRAVFVPNH